jgi:hypothetical protein
MKAADTGSQFGQSGLDNIRCALENLALTVGLGLFAIFVAILLCSLK